MPERYPVRHPARSPALARFQRSFIPDLGWIGFNLTTFILSGERHVRVPVGEAYDSDGTDATRQ